MGKNTSSGTTSQIAPGGIDPTFQPFIVNQLLPYLGQWMGIQQSIMNPDRYVNGINWGQSNVNPNAGLTPVQTNTTGNNTSTIPPNSYSIGTPPMPPTIVIPYTPQVSNGQVGNYGGIPGNANSGQQLKSKK